MHMADALLSPAVGLGFLAASGGVLAYSARQIGQDSLGIGRAFEQSKPSSGPS